MRRYGCAIVTLKLAGLNRLPTSNTLTQNSPGPNVPVRAADAELMVAV